MNDQKKKISILVPVYGVEKYIRRCAISLFEQTYENIEYIFVDDCSPDKSLEILQSVIEQYPMRKPDVRIVRHEKNLGLAAARNTAVENCHTEFLMHVDSDDYIDKNVITECMALVQENVDIVTIGVERIRNCHSSLDKIVWSPDVKEMTRKVIVHEVHNGIWGRLIRTSLYRNHNIRVEVGRGMSEDLQVVPRLFYYARQTVYAGNVFYHYVLNDSSYVSSFSIDKFRQSMLAIHVLEVFFEDKDVVLRNAVAKRKAQSVAHGLLSCAKIRGGKKDYIEIKKLISNETKTNTQLMSIHDKIALYSSSFFLLRVYVVFGTIVKKLLLGS